ncbi:MAG: hypothetical protein M9938_02345, partial [Solirubrobacterales bacterium]|nr:hypothetical protein [Solirubrobacterales bacterium]
MNTETISPADAKAAANGVSPNGKAVAGTPDSTFADRIRDPAYQAYFLLRITFVAAPLLFGIDKFFNLMVDWPVYLAHWYD